MDEAREDADLELELQLAVKAPGRRGDDYRAGPGVDPEQAMRTLTFRLNRRRGLHSPRRAKPPAIRGGDGSGREAGQGDPAEAAG
ncbi:MAG TPA: hypothetical protein VGB04_08800 [Allosphingosinicella sp.]|jgi:hypothetical protein